MADGVAHVWSRTEATRMCRASGQRPQLRSRRAHDSRRQGRQGSRDDVTGLHEEAVGRSFEPRKSTARRGLAAGRGSVALPGSLRAKYPSVPFEWAWQWVFPATRYYFDRETG